MAFIRENAYVRFILFFIVVFAVHLFFDYKEEHQFHWRENLFESLFYVTFYTFMMWLWEDNSNKKRTKEGREGET